MKPFGAIDRSVSADRFCLRTTQRVNVPRQTAEATVGACVVDLDILACLIAEIV